MRNRASLFTFHLTEGLVRGAEDHDGDGVVNLSELYDYVHTALVAEGRQVPQKRFEGDGDVPVALRTVTPDHARALISWPRPPLRPRSTSPTPWSISATSRWARSCPRSASPSSTGAGAPLAWTVESSADWVAAVADQTGVVLHLRPQPGPNRANVFVRDRHSGELKTIRVSVRVRPPHAATARPSSKASAVIAARPARRLYSTTRSASPSGAAAAKWRARSASAWPEG